MPSVYRAVEIEVEAKKAWARIRDVYAIHRHLVPGFVVDTKQDGEERIVTFGNGVVARERILSVDDAQMRHAYAIIGQRFAHHNASIQVVPLGRARCKVVWITDLATEAEADFVGGMKDMALPVMKATLETG